MDLTPESREWKSRIYVEVKTEPWEAKNGLLIQMLLCIDLKVLSVLSFTVRHVVRWLRMVYIQLNENMPMKPFIVTFWGNSLPPGIHAAVDYISQHTVAILVNFTVSPFSGISLNSNVQSIVQLQTKNGHITGLNGWKMKQDNKKVIDKLINSIDLFDKKIFPLHERPLKFDTISVAADTHQNSVLITNGRTVCGQVTLEEHDDGESVDDDLYFRSWANLLLRLLTLPLLVESRVLMVRESHSHQPSSPLNQMISVLTDSKPRCLVDYKHVTIVMNTKFDLLLSHVKGFIEELTVPSRDRVNIMAGVVNREDLVSSSTEEAFLSAYIKYCCISDPKDSN